jgi:hypothetical protein
LKRVNPIFRRLYGRKEIRIKNSKTMGKTLPRRTHLRPSQRVYTKRRIVIATAGVFAFISLSIFVYIQFTQYEYAQGNNSQNNSMLLIQPDKELPKLIVEKSFIDRYPVTLASFTSTINPITIDLRWMCAAEKDNDHFIIERSTSGGVFEEIGTISSTGSLQKCSRYSFTDKNPGSGVLIYRLRQVSHNGSSSFVAIEKTVKNNKYKDKSLYVENIEPKNFKKFINISYYTQTEGGVAVEIFNKKGENVFKAYTQAKRGYNSCRFINGELLTENEYSLRISNSIGAHVQKLKRDA